MSIANRSVYRRIGIFFLLVFAYAALSFPFRDLYFPEGLVKFRLSGFLPMFSGLLLGPMGALACACGNILVDLTGSFDLSDVFGTMGVFLMGWFPCKLWHTLLLPASAVPSFFDRSFGVLKYAIIAFVSSSCAAGFTAAASALLGLFSYDAFFAEVMLQYYDESLFIGMLLFWVLTRYAHVQAWLPAKLNARQYEWKKYLPDYVLCAVVTAAALALQVRSKNLTATVFGYGFVLVGTALMALSPMVRSRKASDDRRRQFRAATGLQAQFITGFLLLFCGVLGFYEFTTIRHMITDQETGPGYWQAMLQNMAGASTAMVVILYALLQWIEARIIRPLLTVSAYADDFVTSGSLSDRPLELSATGNEIDGLGRSVRHMTGELTRYMEVMREQTAAEERAATELEMARRIQFGMLPDPNTPLSGFTVCARIDPAREVGGDFYDFAALDDNRLFVCIADVSGKGVSAALFMMRAKTLIQAADKNASLAQMMVDLNDALADQNEAMMFVTIFVAVVDRREELCTYVNAGHNPPILFSGGSARFLLGEPDMAVGPIEGMPYTEYQVAFAADCGLFLYTDGVTEAQNAAGQFYGEDRLLQTADRLAKAKTDPEEIVRGIREDVDAFVQGAPQADDITVLYASTGE